MENPFKYGGIVRGPYFADRTKELDELTNEVQSLGRTFLVSPRRYGKTCLLFNLMDKVKDLGFATSYIDLNAYPDIKSFAAAITSLTLNALESNVEKLLKVFSGLQRLRPVVTVSQDGSLAGTVEVINAQKEALPALLEGMKNANKLAQKKNKKLLIIIDEFSDLPKYDGQTLEKALRSEIQQHEYIAYLFSGSEQSVMISMLQDKARAFYKLGRIMNLGPIEREIYQDFIYDWFQRGSYDIERHDVETIIDLGQDVPFNIQRLCHAAWELAREGKDITPELIGKLPVVIAKQDSPYFELLWQSASQSQKKLLIALSKDPGAKPFSREFQLTHEIGPSSSIKASLESLRKKAILFKSLDGTYKFSDTFMRYWIGSLRDNPR